MACSSTIPRQLAPTVGPEASEDRIQEGSAFAGIGETIAIGRVRYAGNQPFVLADEYWIPAREAPTRFAIVPVGDVHIFIGEVGNASDSFYPGEMTPTMRTTLGQETIVEYETMQELSALVTKSDPAKKLPSAPVSRTAPEAETAAERRHGVDLLEIAALAAIQTRSASRTAYEQDMTAELAGQEPSSKRSASDLENSSPTQTAPEPEITVARSYNRAWLSKVLEQ